MFEDDAGHDLTKLIDVPHDADYITLGAGEDVTYGSAQHKYKPNRGGGLAHALAVSRQGAQKRLEALRPVITVFDILYPKCACSWVHDVTEHQDVI